MRSNALNQDRVAAGTIAVAALLIVLLLGFAALSSSPSLHLRLCPNANRPDHHCAVTDFTTGLAEVPVAMAMGLGMVLVVMMALPLPDAIFPTAILHRLSSSRAPPAADSFTG